MATSIEQSLNWRNVSTKPDYKVAARRVDTFVQPESDTRGVQIAKALGQAAGGFNTLANSKKAETKAIQVAADKAQAKAAEQVSLLEAMNASNEGERWKPVIKEFTETYDHGLQDGQRPSPEEVWSAFNTAYPDYQESMNNLQTLKGKTAFGDVTGDVFNKTFSEANIARERVDEENALNNNILTKLQVVTLSSQSVEFTEFMRQVDKDIMSFDRSPQEAYTTLGNVASIAARENGDFRVYDYLLGDARGGKAIGGVKEREAWLKEKNIIKAQRAQQKNQRNTEIADKLKADKVALAQEGAALFNSGVPVTGEQQAELIQKYINQGVPNADSLVNTMASNYRAIQKVVMTPEQESNVWQGFIAAGSPDSQRNFIQAQVNNKTISQGLATQLYSRLGNSNDKFLLQDVVYKEYFKGVETLSKKSTGFRGALEDNIEFAYIRPLFQKKYLEMATSPDWKDKDPNVELANLFNAMRELKEINKKDFLSDGKTVNNQNDEQQLAELMNRKLVPNQAALEQWEIHNQDPKFLEMWDKKYERPN
jgi:hypothetical protein